MSHAVPLALRSAHVKLDRANLHAEAAKREFEGFVQQHPGPTMRIDEKAQRWAREGLLTTLALTVDRGLPSLPASLSAVIGDAIHNYRCSLDHVAWQLVQHGADPKPKKPRLIQFPIYESQTTFLGELSTRLPGVTGDPVKFIESCYRYSGGKATNNALILLAQLSNKDKHRSLHVTIVNMIEGRNEIVPTNCRIVRFIPPSGAAELKTGAEAGEIIILSGDTQFTVDVKPQAGINVAVEGSIDIIGLLTEIGVEVTRIVCAPEICDAVK